jgi:hypothetical protein
MTGWRDLCADGYVRWHTVEGAPVGAAVEFGPAGRPSLLRGILARAAAADGAGVLVRGLWEDSCRAAPNHWRAVR